MSAVLCIVCLLLKEYSLALWYFRLSYNQSVLKSREILKLKNSV
jgi:hypothetical protein